MADTQHEHECCRCHYVWLCRLPRKGKKTPRCVVEKAVQVNEDGPYCNACHHEIMAQRHRDAQNRAKETRG